MMRNKYSLEFEQEMMSEARKKKLEELLGIAHRKYNYKITKRQLQLYLSKRQIRYKDYRPSMVRNMGNRIPIGTEYVKPDGMTYVKTATNKREYKQRLIYEQYYGVKLTSDDYIIFLDQDRTNFDINNLLKVTRRESSIVANQQMFSKNPEITKLGISVAKLMIKIKEKENEGS